MANVINATSTGNGGLVSTGDDSGILNIQTNETTAITVDTSQNVGIGGAATNEGGYSRVLQVTGSTEAALELKTGSSYSYFAQNGTTLQIRNNATSGVMTFATEATERMRIDSSGNLLVGSTTNPSTAKFRLYKTGNRASIEAEQGDSGGYNFQSIAFSNGGTYYHCNFQEGSTQRGSITSNGSSTTYATGSDYRLKDNIKPMTNSLQKVLQLKPSIWKWKSNGKNGEGFVAHELQEICPEAVVGQKDAADEDGKPLYQMVDTSFLVATLTAAIQELKAEVDELKAKVNA